MVGTQRRTKEPLAGARIGPSVDVPRAAPLDQDDSLRDTLRAQGTRGGRRATGWSIGVACVSSGDDTTKEVAQLVGRFAIGTSHEKLHRLQSCDRCTCRRITGAAM